MRPAGGVQGGARRLQRAGAELGHEDPRLGWWVGQQRVHKKALDRDDPGAGMTVACGWRDWRRWASPE